MRPFTSRSQRPAMFGRRGRSLGAALLLGALIAGSAMGSTPQHVRAGGVLRIGYQTFGDSEFLKNRGTLEKALAPLGATVQWIRFPAGPQLLEALNVGSIDVGATGEAPPVFAQAGGTHLVYVAASHSNAASEGILVPQKSVIHSLSDLKGKRIAFNFGSNAHYLLIQVLAKAHLSYSDIQPANLAPPDALPAFENGSVDAWVIWDPYLAVEQNRTHARLLVSGSGLDADTGFYLASPSIVASHPDLLKIFFSELQKTDAWANTHKAEIARAYAQLLHFPQAALAAQLRITTYGLTPVTSSQLASQQRIANAFYALKLIPKHIDVAEATDTGPSLVQ